MAEHTPAPWTADRRGGVWGIVREQGCDLILCSHDHAEADAHLVAAAPDLLEALEDILRIYDRGGGIGHIHRARAAIAKARGESVDA
jgi:hypothetical protein